MKWNEFRHDDEPRFGVLRFLIIVLIYLAIGIVSLSGSILVTYLLRGVL